jgi:hypothetical protein
LAVILVPALHLNLSTDPYESYNLLDDYHEIGQELEALLSRQDLQNEISPRGCL